MFLHILRTCRIDTLSCSVNHFHTCSTNIFVVVVFVVSIMNFVDIELSSVGHSTG